MTLNMLTKERKEKVTTVNKEAITVECMHLLKLEFLSFLNISPGVGMLDHKAALFLFFKEISVLFSIVVAPIYNPTNTVQGFPFLHTLSYILLFLFIVALCTTVKIWKQHKCPSTDNWLKKMYHNIYIIHIKHIYDRYTYNAIITIKKWNITICSNMDRSREYHTQWSKSDKHKYYMISHMCNLNNNINEFIYKIEIDSQT